MARLTQQNVELAANFIKTTAPRYHAAFGEPAILNMSTMQYEPQEIYDLKETLEFHRRVGKFVDFTSDLNSCTWDDVHQELAKAQEAAAKSEKGGKQLHRKFWRNIGSTSSILAPGLAALPDELCVLHGGLALVFSVSTLSRRTIDTTHPMLTWVTIACTPQRDEQTQDTYCVRYGANYHRNGSEQSRDLSA